MMNQSLKTPEMNERGFTLTEVLVGTAISLALLALIAGVIQSQGDTFSRQSQLGQMQANGRGATDFVTRSVQNAGFNVTRGKRFLAASDHYITMVYDEDNDGVIQNDEVLTYAVSDPTGANNETFTISPFFDEDGDDDVASTETRDYLISLAITGPPFQFYLITPNNSDSGVVQNKVARDIDNIVFRYYDKDGDALPEGVTVDGNGDPVPPYVIPADELNDIRKVEMDITALSKDEDPNDEYLNSGAYLSGSVAAVAGGTTAFSDHFHRETFSAVTSPRNLVTAPWGKISLAADPTPVSCPDDSTTITASVVDSEGEGVDSGVSVTFNTSDGTVSPESNSTVGSGNATTPLTYDWSSPSITVTLSASALIDVDGEDYPVFNAIPVSFESGTGIFTDDFSDGDSDGWTETGGANWNVASEQYKTASNNEAYSSNGCAAWQDYEAQVEIKRNGSLSAAEHVGLALRYQDSDQYYMAKISCSTNCGGSPNDDQYVLELVKNDTAETTLVSSAAFDFDNNEYYTLKASVVGDDLSAKFWQTSTTEPADYDITTVDTTHTQGQIALITATSSTTYDNVSVTPSS
ncbi:MAG: prepilin-type N-terminal cleavage/methylation domain-containing protein [Nitrospina sp.]|nr:prepilin-type N-terminal cleavage/methylation domain-containing protein [Nitrospina sp.]